MSHILKILYHSSQNVVGDSQSLSSLGHCRYVVHVVDNDGTSSDIIQHGHDTVELTSAIGQPIHNVIATQSHAIAMNL